MHAFTLPSGVQVRPEGSAWGAEYDIPITLSSLQAERLAENVRAA